MMDTAVPPLAVHRADTADLLLVVHMMAAVECQAVPIHLLDFANYALAAID
jgi:hypothetical protein